MSENIIMPGGILAPSVLTETEAIKFLRLDENGPEKPELTLRRYRRLRKLKPTKIGRKIVYTQESLIELLKNQTR